ncbi:hydrogen peroxide-dependent heme synthase [Pseudonocardia sp. CA-107938]|uniref:hydrogen peroxide-dependent heme synthase n=1 Tax=Pseudonocardia sp. CA-107938 TaxID=3240021 RepID=UPI003D917B32
MARLDYAELNSTIRYTMWSVFRVRPGVLGDDRAGVAAETTAFLDALDGKGVTVRGVYDLTGLRADADFMIWWHADNVEALQAAYAELRRSTALGRASDAVWSQVALHRPAEFNKSHVPAFIAGEEPKGYVCVYPFVRSLDWYLLPDQERRQMLADHGKAARGYADVRANTVPAFALGDYEWILAFEADQLDRIVDLMRDLRATEARRHVREETPFFTGPRVAPGALVATLP